MNTEKLVRLAVLGFGMFLLLESITSAAFILADEKYYFDGAPYGLVALPMFGALILATILYVYSGKIRFDNSAISPISMLQAALKLFGVYLLVTSIPLLSAIFSLLFPVREVSSLAAITRPLAIGVTYAIIGYLLSFRTNWALKKLNV